MADRLNRISTRGGDNGTTGLADGSRLAKTEPRIEALGAVDELNCCLGLLLAEELPDAMRADLVAVQHTLFDLGGEISLPGQALLGAGHIASLDERLAEYNRDLPPLREFVLPGGGRAAAACHLARAVCRRAERRLLGVHERETGQNPAGPVYLNRLSDLLFVLARHLARRQGGGEVCWDRDRGGS